MNLSDKEILWLKKSALLHDLGKIGIPDAMTTNRPYRKLIPYELVIKEFERNKGVQFDPEITEIFLGVLEEKAYHLSQVIEPEYYL